MFTNRKNCDIVAFIKKQIDEIKNAPVGGVVQQVSPAEESKKFKKLLDLGVISQEEFDVKRKELLGL
ncbi:MAG: SHOCT domain-containing protein [Ruminococcaceae bacterium]|nr:SHOCT domain-containing protein [Oscillospiraceae bacterium]